MEVLLNDLKVATRRLVREPLFAIVAILTLAIGIGANSAIFTLVNGVLLRPLPFDRPEELVQLSVSIDGASANMVSRAAFLAFDQHGRAFDGVAAGVGTSATLTGSGEPQMLSGFAISSDYFDVLGVPPLLGRPLRPDENQTGSTPVVILGEALWRSQFGADRTIIGRTIMINDRAREVIAVMPAAVSLPQDLQFWVPLEYDARFSDPDALYGLFLRVVGRLKPGVTLDQADADAARMMELAKQAASVQFPNWSAGVRPLHELYSGEARMPLLILLAAVGVVLLIACANLANLLLAQAAARSTDFAVRRAMGASSTRLIRQLGAESLILGLAGGAAGLILGAWGADGLLALMPPEMPRMPGVAIDGTVVLFTFVVSVVSALVFGIAPVMHARRAELSPALREGGRGLAGRAGTRTRSALVLAETALAFALVIAAGLLIRSIDHLRSVDPGFRADNNLTFEVLLPPTRYGDAERVAAFWASLTERLQAVPGVTAAGGINDMPLAGGAMVIPFEVEGWPPVEPGEELTMDVRVATPGYFEAMGVPLLKGRLFTDADRAGSARVALLSEAAVARHFPGEDPIGKRVTMGWEVDGESVWGEVVGVVGSIRHDQLRQSADPEVYFPAAQTRRALMDITVATSGDPAALQAPVRAAIAELDPGLVPARMRPMTEVVAASLATDRFVTRLLSAFSAIALLLAAIGIFGVISYSVAQRRREIGVRMAVGASRTDVIRLIVTGALRLAGAGVLIGIAGALAAAHLLRSMLYGIGAFDPITFVAAGVVLLTVAFFASMLPAWRASRTPPAVVLNSE